MLKEFKQFAMRGNAIDMAVGIIIGGAFGKVVSSLVNDILMPPIGLLLGRVDFSSLFIDLTRQAHPSLKAAQDAGAPTINYGIFVQTVLDFLIIALVIAVLVKQVNRLWPKPEAPAPATPTKDCPRCLSTVPLRATKCAHCTTDLLAA